MEGAEETHATAQARLTTCMQAPFVRDRAALHALSAGLRHRDLAAAPLSDDELAAWDACYHCGMRLDLTVDANAADTWYDAK